MAKRMKTTEAEAPGVKNGVIVDGSYWRWVDEQRAREQRNARRRAARRRAKRT